MKLFISHSSKNADYGESLVKLLTGVGVAHDRIIFTSNNSYGIPVGENIFNWLKDRISEKPFVVYLLSPEYYKSVACLNEMGAAWIVENHHAMIFTQDFDLKSENFKDGAINPREIGFFVDDEDRLTEFIESLRLNFEIITNQVIISQKRREFLREVRGHANAKNIEIPAKGILKAEVETASGRSYTGPNNAAIEPSPARIPFQSLKETPVEKYFSDLTNGRLRDEEIMLVLYASHNSRYSFGTGWRTEDEQARVRDWEELNNLSDTLSSRYDAAISRFDVRNLIKVSEVTSHGNPRQVELIEEMKARLLDLPEEFDRKCEEIQIRAAESKKSKDDDEIPF